MKTIKEKAYKQIKHIKKIRSIPLEKIVIGTTIAVVPGGLLISGMYLTKKKYSHYVKSTDNPDSFMVWFRKNSSQYIIKNGIRVRKKLNLNYFKRSKKS